MRSQNGLGFLFVQFPPPLVIPLLHAQHMFGWDKATPVSQAKDKLDVVTHGSTR